MSKVIIVIDTPEECIDCPCCNCTEHDTYCGMTDMQIEFNLVNGYVKPDWCPLKEIPGKKPQDNPNGRNMYRAGWNDCLDKILGE